MEVLTREENLKGLQYRALAQRLDMEASAPEDETEILHVFDFPQIYTKPSAQALLNTLTLLTSAPPSWECSDSEQRLEKPAGRSKRRSRKVTKTAAVRVNPEGLARYLTQLIGCDFRWIDNDAVKEEIWEQASLRLSERSGRSAMPAISRSFGIPTPSALFDIVIHEPALTADNLGLKTWAASYLLAKRLHTLHLPQLGSATLDILELGAGTGLVGIAAAAVFGASVLLTDLPEIAPNLSRNVETNREAIESHNGSARTAVLDWSNPHVCQFYPDVEQGEVKSFSTKQAKQPDPFPVILAADSLYSPEHPRLLVQTIDCWLSLESNARVMVEFPLREAYTPELNNFRQCMAGIGLHMTEEGEEFGYDDWGWDGGEPTRGRGEVKCWWSVWRRKT